MNVPTELLLLLLGNTQAVDVNVRVEAEKQLQFLEKNELRMSLLSISNTRQNIHSGSLQSQPTSPKTVSFDKSSLTLISNSSFR